MTDTLATAGTSSLPWRYDAEFQTICAADGKMVATTVSPDDANTIIAVLALAQKNAGLGFHHTERAKPDLH